jgi:hypothetical protein
MRFSARCRRRAAIRRHRRTIHKTQRELALFLNQCLEVQSVSGNPAPKRSRRDDDPVFPRKSGLSSASCINSSYSQQLIMGNRVGGIRELRDPGQKNSSKRPEAVTTPITTLVAASDDRPRKPATPRATPARAGKTKLAY